ncbi:hypothetical protein K7X08_037972 [Anisodus acutangulus]|uniref:RNase H type-1 domain-containing protein n=1 Tax=Anisodus acutangulus TaxID=402998 RepID=A0A9Q1MY25_9SOLA|nr:hypothetical protein K7X08_037972 [Anisodus acutangulus]
MGIIHQLGLVPSIFSKWWKIKSNNKVQKMINQIVPIFISWEIWKQWTAYNFGGQKKFYTNKMEYHVWNILAALNSIYPTVIISGTLPNMYHMIERLQPKVTVQHVTWEKTDMGCFTINVDGSFNMEKGQADIGGVIRHNNGNFIRPLSKLIHCDNNNQSEAIVASFAVQWSLAEGFDNVTIETDSLIIINMLNNNSSGNLNLKRFIQEANTSIGNTLVKFVHCLGEANMIDDSLTKLATNSGTETFYSYVQLLPKEVKSLIQLDKWEFSTMRRRYEKM